MEETYERAREEGIGVQQDVRELLGAAKQVGSDSSPPWRPVKMTQSHKRQSSGTPFTQVGAGK